MITGAYGKYKSGKHKSEKSSRETQFGKHKSENIVRNTQIGKLQFGEDESKQYKQANTKREIRIVK